MVPSLDVFELHAELQTSSPPRVLDVREPDELSLSRLEGSVHIPMDDVPGLIGELDPDCDWVVICRTGNRSGTITRFLLQSGFRSVRNLRGGMNDWVRHIDSSMKAY